MVGEGVGGERHLEGVLVLELAEVLAAVMPVDGDPDLVFLSGGRSTAEAVGCTMKMFWRMKDTSSTLSA